MATEQDKSFAEAVIRLKLADASSVGECMKTVTDGDAPDLLHAMIRSGLLDRETADRVLSETAGQSAPASGENTCDAPPAIQGYEMIAKLGEGGMGSVWQARQTSMDRLVAIKILPPLFSRDKKLIERFRREALATAKLNHPNIVSAIDVGTERREGAPDLHYFVMEYVPGESLEDIINREGQVPPARAAQIAAAVAGALDYAWEQAGIVHRDIKPGNILVARDGAVKLADLGLARSAWESATLTTTGLAIGTPHYVSPEQAQGKQGIDTRSDIYALGATMFHMLTGRTMYEADSAAVVMAQHVNRDAPSCRDVNPRVPASLAAVVSKMTRRPPEERYQSPKELLADLVRFQNGDRPLAYTRMLAAHESSQGAFAPPPPEVFVPGAVARQRSPVRRRRWPRALAAALFVGAVGFGVWYAVEQNRSSGVGAGGAAAHIDLWFEVFNPDAVVGSGGTFPLRFNAGSRVRYRVKPRGPAYLHVLMVTSDAASGAVRCRLLTPAAGRSTPLLADTLGQFPEGGGAYPLPPAADDAVFLVAASKEDVRRADVTASLDRMSKDLSRGGWAAAARVPPGRTLWYGHPEDRWAAGGGEPPSGKTAAALDTLCEKVRAAFGGRRVVLSGAAVSCAGN